VLKSVTASSATDAWAVGYYADQDGNHFTLALHWDGTTWSLVHTPSPTGLDDELWGVTAVSATDVWAVGRAEPNTLIVHWDGSKWSRVRGPSPGTFNDVLTGLSARSATDIWAAGFYAPPGAAPYKTLVAHWDGSAWSQVASPTPGGVGFLYGVSARSASDAWAVGEHSNRSDVHHTVTLHWDGSTWSTVSSPSPGSYESRLQGVSAVSPTEVWAAGFEGDGANDAALLMHWDGTGWTVLHGVSGSTQLFGLDVRTGTDGWAVGRQRSRNLVLHWDGTSWTRATTPNPIGQGSTLLGVFARSASDAWAVGEYFDGRHQQTLALHWDGSTWTQT
jgi:hypothetical protein